MELEVYESPDEVAENVYVALGLMQEHGARLNPNGIALWYAYASGKYPDVRDAIDGLLAAGRAIDDEILSDLHERFFSSRAHAEAVAKASQRLHVEIERMRALFVQARDGVESFRRVLSESQIADVLARADAEAAVRLAAEAESALERLNVLAGTLAESETGMEGLQEDIESARRRNLTDELTGVANRQCFDMLLRSAVLQARDESTSLSLVLVDVDNLRAMNEIYGKQAGDHALKIAARALVESVRGKDTVARFGGEEFALILPNTGNAGAKAVVENVRRLLDGRAVADRSSGADFGTMQVSLGFAEIHPGDGPSDLVRRALESLSGVGRLEEATT